MTETGATAATDSPSLVWPSVQASPEQLTVRFTSSTPGSARLIAVSDTHSEELGQQDFWSTLTTIEMESRLSHGGAALQPTAQRQPVASRLDESDADAQSLLTGPVKRLAPVLHAIVASKAARAHFPIGEAYFDVDRDDDDEGSRQLVVVIRADANAAQTLAFWTSLDYELDRWMMDLSDADQEIVTNRMALRFVWDGSLGGG